MDVEHAFAGVAVCAVAADGVVTEEEMRSLEAALLRLGTFRAMGDDELRALVERHFDALRDEGGAALLDRCVSELPPELRTSAFAVAADLIMTDHKIERRERGLLHRLRDALGVSAEEATTIERVLRIKNQL